MKSKMKRKNEENEEKEKKKRDLLFEEINKFLKYFY